VQLSCCRTEVIQRISLRQLLENTVRLSTLL